ncbi:TIR domain-containing protein [Hymenobacter sp. M29]|uniref:TIR domain-containing protein n=1 Tax=Hymenobacter mellowenesis TaxID=3063995 RepID=A0ABT9A8N4_9BACT|nr:TIR domain-containing protein [Hymenobacter sp. M29]MDO7846206.1 TIR domain-containing protein [Hymenobacter sp. M29]
MTRQTEFDIALSFAGEDRAYVDNVANMLRAKGIKVFYDKFEEANLWGKNLYDYLIDVYSNKAFYTIMFVSEHYNRKLWTNLERQAMQSRAFQENQEYILPARFDSTEIPGIFPTVGYISLKDKPVSEFVETVCKKLVLSGRTVPSESIRRSLSPMVTVPKAEPAQFVVTVKDENNELLENSSIFLLADNNTFLKGNSDEKGKYEFEISTRRNYKLYFANSNFPAFTVEKIDPTGDIQLQMHSSENVGSIICDSSCSIPGLKGRLNLILDTLHRKYLYADNIAINGGEQQPASFKLNVPMDLEDCDGIIMQVTVKDIQGSVSLIEYVKPVFS